MIGKEVSNQSDEYARNEYSYAWKQLTNILTALFSCQKPVQSLKSERAFGVYRNFILTRSLSRKEDGDQSRPISDPTARDPHRKTVAKY